MLQVYSKYLEPEDERETRTSQSWKEGTELKFEVYIRQISLFSSFS
jgi:hypothetical protein